MNFDSPDLKYELEDLFTGPKEFQESVPNYELIPLSSINELVRATTPDEKRVTES